MRFENPVRPGLDPDPSVCRVGEEYYLVTSSFEYVPGLPLYRSENLVDWEHVGHALTRPEQLPLENAESSKGIFAPTIRHHDGRFHIVTTNVSDGGHFHVWADEATGEWSDPTWIDAPGIDPDLFWDDGQAFFTYRAGEEGIVQAPIDLDTGELGERRELVNRLAGPFTEAPHLYEVDGLYYLVVAEGGTHKRHMVSVARSESPTGPFEPCPSNPVLTHRTESGMYHPIQAAGHGDLVQAHDDSWWMMFLGIRQHGGHPGWHHLGRETYLAPVTWEDGWPVVNGGEPVDTEMSVPDTDLERVDDPPTREGDLLDAEALPPAWNHRFQPESERYTFDAGTLSLTGSPRTLDDRRPTFLGVRQRAFDCRVDAQVQFDPSDGSDAEAGITALYDEEHHFDLGVRESDGDRRVQLRLRIGDASEIVTSQPIEDGPVTLWIDASTERYQFGVGSSDSEPLGTARTKYLATEVAGGFTGTYLGVYATGHGEECENEASFERFEYRETASADD